MTTATFSPRAWSTCLSLVPWTRRKRKRRRKRRRRRTTSSENSSLMTTATFSPRAWSTCLSLVPWTRRERPRPRRAHKRRRRRRRRLPSRVFTLHVPYVTPLHPARGGHTKEEEEEEEGCQVECSPSMFLMLHLYTSPSSSCCIFIKMLIYRIKLNSFDRKLT